MTPAQAITEVKSWLADARANTLFWYGLAGAAVVIALDQATKLWILHSVRLPELRKIEISGIFDLTYVENRGASFGMLHGQRWLLTLIVCAVVVGLVAWLGRLKRPVAVAGVAFIIGGALGNLYDRLAYSFVVDFLDFSGLYFPWVFNVADMGVNVGVAFLLLDAWQTSRAEKRAG